jgi:asparagine synthase (glutamine-hydrolysing)
VSGLAAVLARQTGGDDSATVRRMLASAPHRGTPSDVAVIGRCTLGVSSPEGVQEASLAVQSGLGVAFAGVLDNAADLVQDLRRLGVTNQFPTTADLLVSVFGHLGDSAVRDLRGIYSAVVTDGSYIKFFRDHLGLGTLFFRHDQSGTFVATEVKQILAGSGIRREPDFAFLEKMLFGIDQDDESPCAFLGVSRAPKASITVATADSSPQSQRYWWPEEIVETGRFSQEETAERFDEAMACAVERTTTGDDLIALSGGLDSPTIAAYAARLRLDQGKRLSALGMIYPDFPSCDESGYIHEVAEYLDIPLHTYQPPPPTLERLADWVQLYDGPWPVWLVPQAEDFYSHARALGFRTILNGEMAEFVADMRRGLFPHLVWQGRLGAAGRYLGNHRRQGKSLRRIGREVAGAFIPRSAVRFRRRSRPGVTIPRWIDSVRVADRDSAMVGATRNQWRETQSQVIFGPTLVTDVFEICQAASGVRVRMPWADVDLWEFFLSLPAEVKFPDGRMKPLVRDLMRTKIPDSIVERKDKTVLNEFVIASIDYPSLRKWLINPDQRMPGVNYELLAEHLEREDLDLFGYVWAKDLAGIQAFLAQW